MATTSRAAARQTKRSGVKAPDRALAGAAATSRSEAESKTRDDRQEKKREKKRDKKRNGISRKSAAAFLTRDLDKFVLPYRIDNPQDFRLSRHNTHAGFDFDKEVAQKIVEANRKRLSDLQERLYAQDRWSVLLIFQGMDAAGKDSAIEHVMSGVNPQGCHVVSFKAPSTQELDHDYLWRCAINLPERGRIGIFNRSHYEEMLVVRVHPSILAGQKIPAHLVTRKIWRERFEDVSNFEKYLARNGTLILKFFLNVSPEAQRQRFLDRLDEPGKRWKFSMGDVAERQHWPDYMKAYQDIVRHTSHPWARWHVVPADHKWFARVIIGSAIVHALERLDLHYPKVDKASLDEFEHVRQALRAEAGEGGAAAPAAPAGAAPVVEAPAVPSGRPRGRPSRASR